MVDWWVALLAVNLVGSLVAEKAVLRVLTRVGM